MTDRFYNAPLGATLAQHVTEAATDGADFVAFRITYDASGASREKVLLAMDAIRYAILQDTFPPA